VADAPPFDHRGLRDAARDRERLIAQHEHAERSARGVPREQAPARSIGRSAQRDDAAAAEIEQRGADAPPAQALREPIERITLRDAADLDARAGRGERGAAIRGERELRGTDARARRGELGVARPVIAQGRRAPEFNERPDRDVEAPAAVTRERERALQQIERGLRERNWRSARRAIEARQVALGPPGAEHRFERFDLGEERGELPAKPRGVAAHELELEDGTHRITPVAGARERRVCVTGARSARTGRRREQRAGERSRAERDAHPTGVPAVGLVP
jgi:hypothetical protein